MRNPFLPARFSFMSANFLGRENGYRRVADFGAAGQNVAAAFAPVATYAERIDCLFGEVAEMGYRGIDLWTPHCDPSWATPRHVEGLLAASARHGVEIVSIAGWMPDDLARLEAICRLARDIGCSLLGMGCAALPARIEEVEAVLARHGVRLGFENHPEELTPAHVLKKIGHGRHPHIGATIDTGWWGTHAYPVLNAVDELSEHLLHVHLKNVKVPGAHDAARWNEGCLDLPPVVRRLRETGYTGWISLEYEPFAGDPTEDCRRFLQAARGW